MSFVMPAFVGKLIKLFDRPSLRAGLLVAAALVVGTLVFESLQHLLAEVKYRRIAALVSQTPTHLLLLAGLATLASYICLMGYDFSSLRYLGLREKVRRSTIGLTSFIAFALGNTVGLGPLAGGAVRMRMFTAAGLEPMQVARAAAFNALAFGFGTTAFGAAALLWGAPDVAELAHMPAAALRAIALGLLAALGWLLWRCAHRPYLRVRHWKIELPHLRLALQQLAITALDLSFAALTLWVLLPTEGLSWWTYLSFYLLALALGVISHVPAGLGVFEAVMLLGIGGTVPPDQLAAALVLYRLIYFLFPLGLAATLLVGYEALLHGRASGKATAVLGASLPLARAAARMSPMLLAALTFIAGIVLLVSGVTPASHSAAELLSVKVPLILVESAHMVGSICGLLLLVLARGLLHRLDAAWWGALAATGISFWLALPKGIAVHEMMYLGFLFSLLLISRRQFNRRSSLFSMQFDVYWLVWLGATLAAVAWIFFFTYRNVAYTNELWWRFEFNANAPRSLRAALAVALITLVFAVWQLLRKPSGVPAAASREELARSRAIIAGQPNAQAFIMLSGDKSVLFSASGQSFLMYGKQGRSWIALFDPVGPTHEWPELIWTFIETAHAHGGRAGFYQVRPDKLGMYLDAGMQARKLGEFAWVPLGTFTLKGGKRANLRTSVNRAERDGLRFAVVPADEVQPLLPKLRAISDTWLTKNRAREKGYSLGAFSDDYVASGPIAVVTLDGEPVAFATLMETGRKLEASIDLMRQTPDSPPGTMDYLFVQLILHYQSHGFERFGLGMAPLSGMASHELASSWHRLARLLFGHGERFYHFRGLRAFKEKFEPQWEPRYLIAPSAWSALLVLMDTAALIGRLGSRFGNNKT
ncbi:MAG: Phosphatidylglycerol lysyltransferase [Paracidovorax wautersii]|uniref:Phosphatidylglycerol lysyltransferase n=1 Tax=Paracidovorax wautersii TaxID=1177982 RepID=A0A7V8FQL6_9BURK|nr:MAG: Phosphatidylglycerol lysyltransferase [Paracidovorax wautersii]